jgi:cytochrome c-type biogenesis protein CcmH/NrfF
MRLLVAIALLAAALGPAAGAAKACSEQALEDQIMCPTCRGQTLAESTAPSAERIRLQIGVWSRAGLSCDTIKDRLERQFGPGILASPDTHGFGLLAWLLPLVALGLGAIVIGVLAWRWSRGRGEEATPEAAAGQPLEPELERRVDDELARFE